MRNANRGFTLIELMMSMGLIALVLLASFYALMQAHYLSVESRSRLLALNAARSTIEAVKTTSLTAVPSMATAGYIPADLPNGAITIATNPSVLTNVSLATVTVTVTWRGPKNALRSLQLSTMRSRY